MAAGITVQIDGGEVEREIFRLTAAVRLADVALSDLVEDEIDHGKQVARKNIQHYVYARSQGPTTSYQRTYKLLNSVRGGLTRVAGAVKSGRVYISREPFTRVYYPVFVEYGYEAGAPYEGRAYWAATIAELRAGIHMKTNLVGNAVARRMVK